MFCDLCFVLRRTEQINKQTKETSNDRSIRKCCKTWNYATGAAQGHKRRCCLCLGQVYNHEQTASVKNENESDTYEHIRNGRASVVSAAAVRRLDIEAVNTASVAAKTGDGPHLARHRIDSEAVRFVVGWSAQNLVADVTVQPLVRISSLRQQKTTFT